MAVTPRAAAVLASLFLFAFGPGCRELALCKGNSCANATSDGATAGTFSDPSGDAGAAGNPRTGEGGFGAGAGGDAGRGEAGEAGATGSANASCRAGLAECDGSTLTPCETQPSFAVRHCGGCDQACDGACVLGTCKPAALVFTGGEARYFVATQTVGYAISSSLTRDDNALVMFDLATGAAEVAMEGLSSFATLSLAGDALYLHDGSDVLRVGFDGNLIAKEDVGFVTAFVATQDGAYLLQQDEGEGDEAPATWSLWYRPNRGAEFEQLWWSERQTRIESWSAYGLVLLEGDRWDETDEAEFTLVNARSIQALGTPPAGWLAVLPSDGVAALLAPGDDGVELWWLRENGARRQALRVQQASDTLFIGDTGIWLHLDEDSAQYLQEFAEAGSAGPKIGLPYLVNPIFMSQTQVWYSDSDWLFDPSYLMRADQFNYGDF